MCRKSRQSCRLANSRAGRCTRSLHQQVHNLDHALPGQVRAQLVAGRPWKLLLFDKSLGCGARPEVSWTLGAVADNDGCTLPRSEPQWPLDKGSHALSAVLVHRAVCRSLLSSGRRSGGCCPAGDPATDRFDLRAAEFNLARRRHALHVAGAGTTGGLRHVSDLQI